MSEKANKQAQRIRDELQQIERIVEHVKTDWGKFLSTSDDGFLKATAYDLHGFYTGIERIFKTIADTIDDNIPGGEMWHKAMLDQINNDLSDFAQFIEQVVS